MRRLAAYATGGVLTFAIGVAATYIRFSGRTFEGTKESRVSAVHDITPKQASGGKEPANLSAFREPRYPSVFRRAETVAGTVEIIHLAPLTWRISLNGKTILENDESTMPDILEHAQQRTPPYDEVMVLERVEGTYCNGGTFWFLALKRDGSYHISDGIGGCFADYPKVIVGSDYVKVKVRGGYGNNPLPGEPYLPGGTWLFRDGRVHKVNSGKR